MIARFGYGVLKLRIGEPAPRTPVRCCSSNSADFAFSRVDFCRMRSSTILLLTLRALSQEAIKNLVLAGVGRLIVMDDQVVSERDLGAGLLFREEDGDVGKKVSRTTYAFCSQLIATAPYSESSQLFRRSSL